MNLTELSKQIHKANVEKGFYENEKNIGEMLALIHSEVSEALECDRKNKYCQLIDLDLVVGSELPSTEFKDWFEQDVKDTFEDEMADIIIRVLDMCGHQVVDIQKHIELKLRYNSLREYKHGKKY